MTEPKTVRVSNGRQTLHLTPKELVQYVSGLSRTAQDELANLGGPIDSAYQTSDGSWSRESLTLDQIIKRVRIGEQPVITGPSDPKLDMVIRSDQANIQTKIDEDSNLAAMRQSIDPWRLTGLPQKLENKIVGADVAKDARNRLSAAHPIKGLAGNLAMGLTMGAGLRAGATALGLTAAKGSAKALAGRLVAEEVGIGTAFYVTDTLNNNKPLVAEDLARTIVGGMLITAPIFGGIALRNPVRKLLNKGAPSIAGAASKAADVMVGGGIVTGNKAWLKYASATRVGGRASKFMKRAQEAGPVTGVANAAKQAERLSTVEGATIKKLRPGLKSIDADDVLRTVDEYLDNAKQVERLHRVEWGAVTKGVQGIRSAAESVRKSALGLNKKVQKVKYTGKSVPKFSEEGRLAWSQQAEAIYEKLDNLGAGDSLSYLDRARRSKKPWNTYSDFVQARLTTALGDASGAGGRAEATVMLRNFLEDSVAWGGIAKKGKRINAAIDKVADSYRQLDHLTIDLADNLNISAKGTRLTDITAEMRKLEKAIGELQHTDLKVISEAAAREVDTALIGARSAMTKGARPYEDLAIINKAREVASQKWKNLDSRFVKRTAQEMYDEAEQAVLALANRKEKWTENIRAAVTGGSKVLDYSARGMTYGLNALWHLDEEGRRDLYDEVTETLNAYTGSPFALDEAMGDYLGPMTADDPELASMTGVSAGNTVFWLQSQIPKTDRSVYGRGVGKAKRDEFNEKFVAAIDPMSVPEVALKGMATNGAVAALRVANPELYAEIGVLASEILDEVDLETLPRVLQNGLNQLLGGIDPLYTGPALLELQSNYAQTPVQQQVTGGAGGMPDGSNPQKPGNQFTFTQRLSSY